MKHWKISIVPVAAIILILLVNGGIASGVLIPVGVVISLVSAHLMFKKASLMIRRKKPNELNYKKAPGRREACRVLLLYRFLKCNFAESCVCSAQ